MVIENDIYEQKKSDRNGPNRHKNQRIIQSPAIQKAIYAQPFFFSSLSFLPVVLANYESNLSTRRPGCQKTARLEAVLHTIASFAMAPQHWPIIPLTNDNSKRFFHRYIED